MSTFQTGGSAFPLSSSVSASLLKDADPALHHVLEYLRAVIGSYLADRLVAEAQLCRAPISAAVAMALPYDPVPYLTESQVKFPLLAVYRTGETFEDQSVHLARVTSEWGIAYVLPPLTGGQAERLLPALSGVSKIVDNRIGAGKDPAYLSGAAVWQLAGVSEIGLTRARYGAFEGTGNLMFHAWLATLRVRELSQVASDALGPLTGIDTTIDAEQVSTVLQFKDDY